MKEIWKKINNNYMVSNLGNVKSKNKILKPLKHDNGYLYVAIDDKQYTIHRLVAKAFLENQKNKKYINHIDGDKTNNNINNLEWCTASENMQHAFKNKLINFRTKRKRESELINIKKATISNYKKVKMFDKNGIYINTFNNINEASKISGANASHIVQCCKHKEKTSGGYKWEYANER